jgi:hypothetical protein
MNDEQNRVGGGVHRSSFVVDRLISSVWFGGAIFLVAVAAPAAFSSSPNTTVAADVVGAMLTRWHYIALAAPLLLLAMEWRSARTATLVVLFVAIVFASLQAMCDTRIRTMRMESLVPISSLPRQDFVRRRFGLLHGISSLLLLAEAMCAAVVVARRHDESSSL